MATPNSSFKSVEFSEFCNPHLDSCDRVHCAAGAEAHKPATKPTALSSGLNSISSRFSRLAQAEKQAFSATLLSSADLDDPSHLTLLSIEALRCVNPTLNIHPAVPQSREREQFPFVDFKTVRLFRRAPPLPLGTRSSLFSFPDATR